MITTRITQGVTPGCVIGMLESQLPEAGDATPVDRPSDAPIEIGRYELLIYDIPWNPNRLEQRMGRVHRDKQERYRIMVQMTIEMPERAEFLDSLGRFGVSPFQYGADDIVEEANRA